MSDLRADHRPGLLLPVLLRSQLRLLPLLQVLLRLRVKHFHVCILVHVVISGLWLKGILTSFFFSH